MRLINLHTHEHYRDSQYYELDATNIAICPSEGGCVLVVRYGVPTARRLILITCQVTTLQAQMLSNAISELATGSIES